jgi:hypothetical protein
LRKTKAGRDVNLRKESRMSPEVRGTPATHISTKVSPTMRIRRAPKMGDVLASGRSARADVHEISVVPAEPETVVRRYADAIEKVKELARTLGVDGWYTSDYTHYIRVATYRPRDEAASRA